jgi:hypothetical protein
MEMKQIVIKRMLKTTIISNWKEVGKRGIKKLVRHPRKY